MTRLSACLLVLLFACPVHSVHGELSVASLFSDHMVIQQGADAQSVGLGGPRPEP